MLFLNQYFPPDASATAGVAHKIVESLSQAGYLLQVIAGAPSYDVEACKGGSCGEGTKLRNTKISRVSSTTFSRTRMSGRVANYLSFMFLAFFRSLRTRADVVITMTDPPIVGFLGAVTSVARRIPFIYNIQDLHPEMALASGLIKEGWFAEVWSRIHLLAMRRAALIVVPGFDMRARIAAKGVAKEKIIVVRNIVGQISRCEDRNDPAARALRQGLRFTLVHAGNLGFYGAWESVIEAARRLEHDGVGLIFVGGGAAETLVRKLAADCNNVRFVPYRPKEEIAQVMAAGDLQLVTVKDGCEGLVVPSKLYTILSAGRPVLVVAPGACDAAKLVEDSECGVVVSPDNPNVICDSVRMVLSDRMRLERMGNRAVELSRRLDSVRYMQLFVKAVDELCFRR